MVQAFIIGLSFKKCLYGAKMKKISDFTIIVAFILFFVLLIVGVITASIMTIVSAFIVGFFGYAILEHEAK